MVFLDGKAVENSEISPARHKFIGTFRPPYELPSAAGYVYCGCGNILQNQQQLREHWQSGHFDAPQYVTITDITSTPT